MLTVKGDISLIILYTSHYDEVTMLMLTVKGDISLTVGGCVGENVLERSS